MLFQLNYRLVSGCVVVGVVLLWILGGRRAPLRGPKRGTRGVPEGSGGLLGGPEGALGAPGGVLGAPGGVLGGPWGAPGGSWGGPGGVLGGSLGVLGGPPVGSWADLGGSRASRGFPVNAWHRFKAHLGPPRGPQDPPRWITRTPKK